MGGLRLAQMTMLENGWSVQAKKMTDTVGTTVSVAALHGSDPSSDKGRGVVQTAAPPYPCGKERSGSLLPWEPLSLLLQ